MRSPDLQQLEDRELALIVSCRYCQAPSGQPCTTTDNTGTHELTNFPAHLGRITRAQRIQRLIADRPRSPEMPHTHTDPRESTEERHSATHSPSNRRPVVGIDPSLTGTGIAIIINNTPQLQTIASRGKRDDTWQQRATRLTDLRNRTMNLIPRNTELAIIEGPAYAAQGSGNHDRAGYWWMLYQALTALKIPTAVCPPTTRAKWATDKGNAGKADVAMAIAKHWPETTIRGDDQADALCFATIAAQHLNHPMPYLILERHKLALTKIAWPQMQ
ncbi:hypothetical protein C7T36_18345 [Rhodococcus sp. AD45-ID]|uniref:zinc finger domain-containing protein n=1 Tax=unclassified Rhodococcus (in: high G+C Gram-positive bacteria) TaxID=192944 RepID=UPI0005E123E5|nr:MULTISPECIES: hypothetical protein [unclassified Rhodococcus (in: high G+C Gram-positive bacteria)]KJF21941.1 Holliday junction resolvase [Rhodococcus sp. AD45]PSR39639.1 hypothetical protein C7T36_18345 [Rhodococcus sp. AD45-ID]